MKNIRKMLSIILSAVMILSALSVISYAETEECVHSYSSVHVAPTCIERGFTFYSCVWCGDNYKDYRNGAEALGHSYGEWYDIDEATCVTEGHIQRDCGRCGASEVKTSSVLEHADKNSDGLCDVCSFEMEASSSDSSNSSKVSPFDWLVALFNAMIQWFKDIFA